MLRGRILTFSIGYKKSSSFFGANTDSPTELPDHRKVWREAEAHFDLWADAQERIHKSLSDLQYHKFANKAGKLLARLCKGPHTPTHIQALKDIQGKITSVPKDINLILERFYANLYGHDPIDDTVAKDFLAQVTLPKVDQALLNQLNAPVTLVEVSSAIATLANGKNLFPDEYTSEPFKLASGAVSPALVSVYQSILD